MELQGLHILLTYQCILECDHCFVWGSPNQQATFTLEKLEQVFEQAQQAGVEWIYFEGGEPFLYYALLLHGAKSAVDRGFNVGIVSNGYWALGEEEALFLSFLLPPE